VPASTELLTLTERRDGHTVVLALSGEADLASAPPVGDRVSELLSQDVPRMQLDLSDLGFLDSSAVRVFLRCRQNAATAGVPLDVVCEEGPARRVLTLLGLRPEFGLPAPT
jgi:anti-anti-sigma factor